MLNPAVKLVENPGGIGPLSQQFAGLDDEIVEIIVAVTALNCFVFADNCRTQPQRRQGCGNAVEIAKHPEHFEQAALLLFYEILDPQELPHR